MGKHNLAKAENFGQNKSKEIQIERTYVRTGGGGSTVSDIQRETEGERDQNRDCPEQNRGKGDTTGRQLRKTRRRNRQQQKEEFCGPMGFGASGSGD